MEDFKKRADFRNLLRDKLTAILGDLEYSLVSDNKNQDQSISRNWVFRLKYSGKRTIEICNEDWRDYTEYFLVKIGDDEVYCLNLDHFPSLEYAFEQLVSRLLDKI